MILLSDTSMQRRTAYFSFKFYYKTNSVIPEHGLNGNHGLGYYTCKKNVVCKKKSQLAP